MLKYDLFVDSDCDVDLQFVEKYQCKMISMPYILHGKEIRPYVDWQEFDAHAFYDELRRLKANELPSTCGLSVQNYIDYFEPSFKEGRDILYVHFSSAMTMTFGPMREAVEQLKAKYPGVRFEEIDALGITTLGYIITHAVAEQYIAGKSIDEILKWAKEEVQHYAIFFYADNLKFFKKSGRVSGFSAFMGDLVGVKPIIHMSSEGKMVSIDKAVGRAKALNKLIQYVDDYGDNIKDYEFIVADSDADFLADRLCHLLKAKFGKDLEIARIKVNPTAGSHCGPDGLGVCFHAKHRAG